MVLYNTELDVGFQSVSLDPPNINHNLLKSWRGTDLKDWPESTFQSFKN